MEGYTFSHDVRVRFAETDAQGIAHHASFVVWLEEARIAYLARFSGGYRSIQERGVEALTTGVEIRYARAAHFDDVLTIWARCVDVRGARFRYEYVIGRGDETVATATTDHATVDRETHRPIRVPPWFADDVARARDA